MAERTPEQIQDEIEQARIGLAHTLDQLADRTSPKRLAQDAKQSLTAKARTPAGMAVLGVVAAGVGFLVFRSLRHRG